jgi:hypothetical protein
MVLGIPAISAAGRVTTVLAEEVASVMVGARADWGVVGIWMGACAG